MDLGHDAARPQRPLPMKSHDADGVHPADLFDRCYPGQFLSSALPLFAPTHPLQYPIASSIRLYIVNKKPSCC